MTEWTLDSLASPVDLDGTESLDVPDARPDRHPFDDLVAGKIVDDAELDVLEWFGDRLHEAPIRHAVDVSSRGKAGDMVRALEQKHWLIATGLVPMVDRLIRIGHMGDLEPVHLKALLAELTAVR